MGSMLARLKLLELRASTDGAAAGEAGLGCQQQCMRVRTSPVEEGGVRGSEPKGMAYLERHLGPRWGRRRRRG